MCSNSSRRGGTGATLGVGELALGQRAMDRFLELINAGSFEVVATGRRDMDSYGRKLRLIERDGHSLGAILVSEGLARRWDGAQRSGCG
jgi:endonuclease YncB( thermonuclease family)